MRPGAPPLPPQQSMHDEHPSWSHRIRAAILITRPELGVMAMASAYIGAGGQLSPAVLLAMPAVFLITAGSMSFNDYFDRDLDRAAHPARPIPAGVLQPREVLRFSIALFTVAVVLSILANPWCFVLAVVGIAFLVLYETRFKQRGFVGNVVVAVLSSLAFPFGGAAVGRPWDAALLSTIAFFVLLGREILMDTRDMSADATQRFTLPMRIGRRPAVRIGALAASITILLTPCPLTWGVLSRWYLVLFIPADALLAYGIILALDDVENAGRATDLFRIAMALAIGAFLLGILA